MTNLTLYGFSVLCWGTAWFAINFQLGVVPPEVSVVYRYVVASALLFCWCLFRGIQLRYKARDHLTFALFGLLLFGLNYAAAYLAQEYIPSALNAVAFSSLVWMNLINSRLFLGTRLAASVVIGAVVGMTGIVTLFWPDLRDLSVNDDVLVGAALSLGAAFVASLGNIVSQLAQARKLPITASNSWGMLYGAVAMATLALIGGKSFVFEATASYIGSLLYLAVFASVLGFGCYLTLLGRIGAHRAGYVVVMLPVVAIAMSAIFEGLMLTGHIVAGLLLVLTGNTLVLSRRWTSGRPVRCPQSTADFSPGMKQSP